MKRSEINKALKSCGKLLNELLEILYQKASEGLDIRIIYDGCDLLNSKDGIKEHTMHRILVNNIRHDHTNYDKGLRKIKRQYGVYYDESVYTQYKNAVLNKIAMNYPFLAEECARQKGELCMIRTINR